MQPTSEAALIRFALKPLALRVTAGMPGTQMSSNPVTALLPAPIQEKHSPPIPLTSASTRNTLSSRPGNPCTSE